MALGRGRQAGLAPLAHFRTLRVRGQRAGASAGGKRGIRKRTTQTESNVDKESDDECLCSDLTYRLDSSATPRRCWGHRPAGVKIVVAEKERETEGM